MYAQHRNSDSFREEQARKKIRREHPVNANISDSDLIDVNALISSIDNKTGTSNVPF